MNFGLLRCNLGTSVCEVSMTWGEGWVRDGTWRFMGLGFKVQALGFKVEGLRFRV